MWLKIVRFIGIVSLHVSWVLLLVLADSLLWSVRLSWAFSNVGVEVAVGIWSRMSSIGAPATPIATCDRLAQVIYVVSRG